MLGKVYSRSLRHRFFRNSFNFLVALVTCDLGVTLEITGGVSATVLAFIFPAACFLMLTPTPWHNPTMMPAVTCVTFGLIVMVVSLVSALGKVWTREGDAKICV